MGQKTANDNAQNQPYPTLDKRIAATYAALTDATLKNSLYDSYIRAFRWASDKLPADGGVVAFVSNGAWLDSNSADGFRKSLETEFSTIYVFNLRGNQRTSGELSRKEGGKIFGSGSRTPIAVTLLVKNPQAVPGKATIQYHDIGDYHSRDAKLALIKQYRSIGSPLMPAWRTLTPNAEGDWLSQRSDAFGEFIPLGDKDDKTGPAFFNPVYGRGLATSRDAWCYNSSKDGVATRMAQSVAYYNGQVEAFIEARKLNPHLTGEAFIKPDSTKFSWDRANKEDLPRGKFYTFAPQSVYQSLYRPFFKQWAYFNRQLNNCVYKLPAAFPTNKHENLVICLPAPGGNKDLSVTITDALPDLHLIGDAQCFPLYYYDERPKQSPTLFDAAGANDKETIRRDGISDFIWQQAKTLVGATVTKEDIFYYVYGLLHSPAYRAAFAADLKKMLPRLPLLDAPRDFFGFSRAGRQLAALHIGYETGPPCPSVTVTGAEPPPAADAPAVAAWFRVEKMRFPKKGQLDTIVVNSRITVSNIPPAAYAYVVNGKSAIEWVMERYQVTTHKESHIRNDPNDWAAEAGKPRYILDLLLRVIEVSLRTQEIVAKLPEVSFG